MFSRNHSNNVEIDVYFNVPFCDKDKAKAIGMRWNNSLRLWYFRYLDIFEEDKEDKTLAKLCPGVFCFEIINVSKNHKDKNYNDNLLHKFLKIQIPTRRKYILEQLFKKKYSKYLEDKYTELYGEIDYSF